MNLKTIHNTKLIFLIKIKHTENQMALVQKCLMYGKAACSDFSQKVNDQIKHDKIISWKIYISFIFYLPQLFMLLVSVTGGINLCKFSRVMV